MGKTTTLKKKDPLLKLPNVGPAVAEDLHNIGIRSLADLKGKNPDVIYAKLEKYEGHHVNRCMLYVIRSLVYMADKNEFDPKKIAWWYFKD